MGIVQVYEVRRRIFVEKRFKDLARDAGILIEHALFLDTIGPLTARQGPLVVSNMADEVKVAHLLLSSLEPQLIQEYATRAQLIDNRLLLMFRVPRR